VVIDTNIFMGARYNPRSSSARILEMCASGRCIPLLTPKIEQEMKAVLRQARKDQEFRRKLRFFMRRAERIEIERELPLLMEDPADNKFLNCALFGKADFLVTSDRHLLKLRRYLGLRICNPGQFLRALKKKFPKAKYS
jgi:hypothetical protein